MSAPTTPKRIDQPVAGYPERSRSKGRVSKSQPSSRSASPSRLSFTSMQTDSRGHRVRRKSGIPAATSRDASMERRLSGGARNRPYIPNNLVDRQTPLMAEKILQQSQEAEAALEDALTTDSHVSSARKRFTNLYDDHSDESETSRFVTSLLFGLASHILILFY